MRSLKSKHVLLMVTGSIAAFKVADIASKLVQLGATVTVAMSESATEFVGPATFVGLTGRPVLTQLFEEPFEGVMAHIHFPQNVDAILVAPATANTIAQFANGIADDLISTMLLAATAPVIIAPAMNNIMLASPATRENLATVTQRGATVVEPEEGRLACGSEGDGRLASTDKIIETVTDVIFPLSDFNGKNILITCGATREPIDPVRFISNRSSGKMGVALAEAALERGANVTLILGFVEVTVPDGMKFIPVETTLQMKEAVEKHVPHSDIAIFAAAPADFAPTPATHKLKRRTLGNDFCLSLHQTPDIIGAAKPFHEGKIFVGFAAETEDLERHALQKLEQKSLDMIVANDVSKPGVGFGHDTNSVTIFRADGGVVNVAISPKRVIADHILNEITRLTKRH